ncbi:sulfur oxidation c-type cytochrome SoxX [Thioalkalivibrio sulfidiphilus]|uniref:sulfur oxidation c-type cytochrome SoxX n=1 Tax=Thioalkalivibrio sulfidiphilus TaxID=1033854 RepID=UPI0003644BEF|nr:sulfur oxidation c-type cytochrome SoxX [Thioalkalivibrio sulfidiphilus]
MCPASVAERALGAAALVLLIMLAGFSATTQARGLSALERQVEAVIRDSWGDLSGQEARRLVQDDTQLDCSRARNQPGPALSEEILSRERARIRYPEGGLRPGDPVMGAELARSGYGGRVGARRPDDPGRANGGNCQACHMLEPRDDAGGTLGPSLAGYGIGRGLDPEALRHLYERIYNPQSQMPCSAMPRFGHNGFLTPEQILDIAAYLLHPDSPVNRTETLREAPADPVRPVAPR